MRNNTKYYCACNGLLCNGICRQTHLGRKRDWAEPKDKCPSAYTKESYHK